MKVSIFDRLARALLLCSVMLVPVSGALAQGNVLEDVTGDGAITVLAFGDSITYGVGDGSSPGDFVDIIDSAGAPRGYPLRLSSMVAASVENAGLPGEPLLPNGVERFPSLVVGSDVDTVIIMEGTNDAPVRAEARDYHIGLQRLVNVALAEGKGVVINTLPPPTGNHASLAPYTGGYSSIVREIGVLNSVPVADIEAEFVKTCPIIETCQLYNLPEGLHPNTLGYDAITAVIKAALGG